MSCRWALLTWKRMVGRFPLAAAANANMVAILIRLFTRTPWFLFVCFVSFNYFSDYRGAP